MHKIILKISILFFFFSDINCFSFNPFHHLSFLKQSRQTGLAMSALGTLYFVIKSYEFYDKINFRLERRRTYDFLPAEYDTLLNYLKQTNKKLFQSFLFVCTGFLLIFVNKDIREINFKKFSD